MADKIEDGGPAFPTDASIQRGTGCDGMSIRDYFAGQSVIGLMQADMQDGEEVVSPHLLARTAYRMADAMLAARKAGA